MVYLEYWPKRLIFSFTLMRFSFSFSHFLFQFV